MFRRPKCEECGSKIGFSFVFELAFHFLTNMPVALLTVFLVFSQGVAIGVASGLGIIFTLAYLAAGLAPLEVRGPPRRPADRQQYGRRQA